MPMSEAGSVAPAANSVEARSQKRKAPSKRTLFIHIGAHKAGSTSLQMALAQNPAKLSAAGAHYLKSGRFADAHHFVYYAALHPERESSAAVFEGLSSEIAENSARNYILSAEGFEFLSSQASLTPFHTLKRELNLEVVVVFLVRHHAEQVNSAYVQVVRELASGRTFSEFALPRIKRKSLRYRAPIEFWSAVADRHAVMEFSASGLEGLLSRELGVDLLLPHANASINTLAVEALRLTAAAQSDGKGGVPAEAGKRDYMNDYRSDLRARNATLIDQICERAARHDDLYPKFWGFSPWQWDKLMQNCAEDAEFLRSRFGVALIQRENRERAMVRAPYSLREARHLRDVLGGSAEAALGPSSPS